MKDQSKKILSNIVKVYVRTHKLKPKTNNAHRDIMCALNKLQYSTVIWSIICELFEKYYIIPLSNLW